MDALEVAHAVRPRQAPLADRPPGATPELGGAASAVAALGPVDGDRLGQADSGALARAARAAIGEAGSPDRAWVRIEARVCGGVLAVPLAGDRELAPVRVAGDLPTGLVLPARPLRRAGWAGLRDGRVAVVRATDGRLLLLAQDAAGHHYRLI